LIRASINLRNIFQSECFSKKDGYPDHHPGRGLKSELLRAYPVAKTSYDVTQRLHFGFGGF
jgi:hypothetical protein